MASQAAARSPPRARCSCLLFRGTGRRGVFPTGLCSRSSRHALRWRRGQHAIFAAARLRLSRALPMSAALPLATTLATTLHGF